MSLPIIDSIDAPRAAQHRERRLIDSHGRTIRDLRLSITDRCNFRCVYCMNPDVRFMEASRLLDVPEMIRLVRVCAGLGVHKVRITGGEPTVHPELIEIIRGVRAAGISDIAMTTNGSLLNDDTAELWKRAGLGRITISIDAVEEDRFSRITRSSLSAGAVVDAIRAAQRAGFETIKANAVIIRGVNDDQVEPLARLGKTLGIELRYIEYMPLDSGHAWERGKLVPAAEIIERVSRVFPLELRGRESASSTSLDYAYADGSAGGIGVIAPVSRPFCGACSRLRITADGKVRPCLFSIEEWDVRSVLRAGADDPAVERFLIDAVWTKQGGHGINSPGFVQPDRPMSAIGG